ncbi:protein PSK SIMULATOR 1 [Humulus lupulus]|uniref:protein PSK SIMULATOR 1 n=1 Tax=Humulus lupulus TaxID=3486 RepID=UPI002B408A16|nr:protein PSK SIMULATOR 1 [Humulus lupulus]
MALETWLIKVKTAISSKFDVVRSSSAPAHPKSSAMKKSNVGVLAFEIAGLMSKLIHLWQLLSDKNMIRLRNDSISLDGVRKIISNDEAFLLALACAEIVENVRLLAKSVSRIGKRCDDVNLWNFDRCFRDFADSGRDPHAWVLSLKDMEVKNKKMDRYVTVTAALYREIDELSVMEGGLRKLALQMGQNDVVSHETTGSSGNSKLEQKITDLQQKILWQRQEVKYLKERSLWNRSFDTVTSVLVRSIFTLLARTKLVFGLGVQYPPSSLPRSLSASAAVHPSESDHQNPSSLDTCHFVSGPLMKRSSTKIDNDDGDEDDDQKKTIKDSATDVNNGFFESNSKLLKPPPLTTLGAAGLALHYANLIIVMEKMIKSPQLVGVDARDDLYSMLPNSIRSSLRSRLRGVGFSASDPVLAGEWREALGRILAWLSPLAHNMIKWQSERSFEQQNLVPKTNVLLLQTLFFANKEKTEAAITELLVGLNYIWRFEREMTAKALFECHINNNLNGLLMNNNLQSSSS